MVLVSILVGGILFLCAGPIADKVFSKPHLSFYIGLTALCVIFRVLIDFNTQAIRGLRLIRTFALMQIVPNAAFMLILLGMVAVSRQAEIPFMPNWQAGAWPG